MKKQVFTAVVLLAWMAASAQGLINFGNGFPGTQGRFPIYGDEMLAVIGQSSLGVPSGNAVYEGPLLQGTGYTLALFAGPSTVTDASSLVFVTSAPFRTATANVLPAGLVYPFTVAVNGVLAGSTAKIQYRAWDNCGGTYATWESAAGHTAIGHSGLFTTAPLGGMAPDGTIYLTPNAVATSFNIFVPEPHTAALALFGVVLLFRRSRQGLSAQEGRSLVRCRRSALP